MSQLEYDRINHNRRNNFRDTNRKIQQQQQQQTQTANSNNCNIKIREQKTTLPEKTTENEKEKEKECLRQQTDKEQQENLPRKEIPSPTSSQIDDDSQSFTFVKQRHKNRSSNPISSTETIIPSKPQMSVPPTKQTFITNGKPFSNHQDNHIKSNGYTSSSYPICTYSPHNPLPPRFQQQQQQQQKETIYSNSRFRRRRGGRHTKRSRLPHDSITHSNDFVQPSEEYEQEEPQQMENQEMESPTESGEQQELSTANGYSSESDILTDSTSTADKTTVSPLVSTSTGSPSSSVQRLNLVCSLATTHGLLDELISIFDTTSFSSEELEIILNKIASTHILNQEDLQRLKTATKNEKIFERIRDETYRSQAKILAIELQTEKTRILELTKANAEMENTIRQLQQQTLPNTMFQYQQMIINFQMNLRRLADENLRLQHQLNAYAMMPATLNELKQQEQVLREQIRQMSIRTGALEKEVAESERASKNAAELFKKADAQKQERIEQMFADMNKYKKLDKELTILRQKYTELEQDSQDKLTEMTKERDHLKIQCDELKEKLSQYEQKSKSSNEIEEEIHQLKSDNNQLRRSNWKAMEEVNKLSNSRSKNVSQSS